MPVDSKVLQVLGSNHLDKVMFQGKTGLQVTKSVYSFFTTYIQEQKQLAVMLAQMSTDEIHALKSLPFPDRMQGCLDCCINFFQQSKEQSEALMNMVNDMIRGVIGPMESFMEAQKQLNESTENMTAQIMNGKHAHTTNVLAKQALANEAINELNKTNVKKKKEYDLKSQKAKAAVLAYKEALRSANETTIAIATIEAPASVTQVLDMERLRITSLGQVFEKYGNIQLDYAKNTEAIIARIRSFTSQFDDLMTTDVNNFVSACLEDQSRSSLLVPMNYHLTPLALDENDEGYNFTSVVEDMVSSEDKKIPALRKLYGSSSEISLPLAFDVLARTLEGEEVLRTKGLFTTNVPKQNVSDILNQVECGVCNLSKFSPVDVSASLKIWFRQLSPSLISSEQEKGFLAIGKAASKAGDDMNGSGWDGVKKALKLATSKLPKTRAELLRRYGMLLARAVETNKGVHGYLEQLAFACAPCVFPSHTEEDLTKASEFTTSAQNFLIAVIKIQAAESNEERKASPSVNLFGPSPPPPSAPSPRERVLSSLDPSKPPLPPPGGKPALPNVPKTPISSSSNSSNSSTPSKPSLDTTVKMQPTPPPPRASVSKADVDDLFADVSSPAPPPPKTPQSSSNTVDLWGDEPTTKPKSEMQSPKGFKLPDPRPPPEHRVMDSKPVIVVDGAAASSPSHQAPLSPQPPSYPQPPSSPQPQPPSDPRPTPPQSPTSDPKPLFEVKSQPSLPPQLPPTEDKQTPSNDSETSSFAAAAAAATITETKPSSPPQEFKPSPPVDAKPPTEVKSQSSVLENKQTPPEAKPQPPSEPKPQPPSEPKVVETKPQLPSEPKSQVSSDTKLSDTQFDTNTKVHDAKLETNDTATITATNTPTEIKQTPLVIRTEVKPSDLSFPRVLRGDSNRAFLSNNNDANSSSSNDNTKSPVRTGIATGSQSSKFPLPRAAQTNVTKSPVIVPRLAVAPGDIVEVMSGVEKYGGLRGTVVQSALAGEWEVLFESGEKATFKPALLKKSDKPVVVVGDYLRVKTNSGERVGVVRFVGTTNFADGEWIGLELPADNGKNDGSVKGHAYFKCEPNHGLFIQHLTIIEQSKTPLSVTPAPAVIETAPSQAHADIRAKLALLGNLGGKLPFGMPPVAKPLVVPSLPPPVVAEAEPESISEEPNTEGTTTATTSDTESKTTTELDQAEPAGVAVASEGDIQPEVTEEPRLGLNHVRKVKVVGGRRAPNKVAFKSDVLES